MVDTKQFDVINLFLSATKLMKEADLCFCKVYSEKTATLQWQFMFTVVKYLDALQLVLFYNIIMRIY